MNLDEMIIGERYEVTFLNGVTRVPTTIKGKYLGMGMDRYQFDLRPLYGTAKLPAQDIVEVHPVRKLPSWMEEGE